MTFAAHFQIVFKKTEIGVLPAMYKCVLYSTNLPALEFIILF